MSNTEIRVCKIHGETVFAYGENEKRFRCRKCRVDAVNKRRKLLKQKAIDYKGGKCSCCGYNKSHAALEFHHTDPNEKDFGISAKGYTRSWDKMKEELDKCILVCSNCHREIHESLRQD